MTMFLYAVSIGVISNGFHGFLLLKQRGTPTGPTACRGTLIARPSARGGSPA